MIYSEHLRRYITIITLELKNGSFGFGFPGSQVPSCGSGDGSQKGVTFSVVRSRAQNMHFVLCMDGIINQ